MSHFTLIPLDNYKQENPPTGRLADFLCHDALKQQAELIFSDIGLSLSAATTIFLKQVVRCNGIPFKPLPSPFSLR